jgi:hypothetical protein
MAEGREGREGRDVRYRQECSMILDVQQRHVDPDVSVLEFSGRLQLGSDLGAAEHRIRKLVAAGRRNLVFDFSKLESIDRPVWGWSS